MTEIAPFDRASVVVFSWFFKFDCFELEQNMKTFEAKKNFYLKKLFLSVALVL